MRGHGNVIVASSVKQATVYAVYTDINARMQAASLALNRKIVSMARDNDISCHAAHPRIAILQLSPDIGIRVMDLDIPVASSRIHTPSDSGNADVASVRARR